MLDTLFLISKLIKVLAICKKKKKKKNESCILLEEEEKEMDF